MDTYSGMHSCGSGIRIQSDPELFALSTIGSGSEIKWNDKSQKSNKKYINEMKTLRTTNNAASNIKKGRFFVHNFLFEKLC
jgi:hypothetical protein